MIITLKSGCLKSLVEKADVRGYPVSVLRWLIVPVNAPELNRKKPSTLVDAQ